MANEINKIKIESTEYTLQDSRVDSLVTGVSSVNGKTGDVTITIPSVPVNATTSAVAPSACTSNGFYYVSSSTNSLTDKDGNPFLQYHTSNNDFRILATAYSASWIQQIATDFRSEHVYIRRCENGTWKPWTKVAQTSEIPTTASDVGALSTSGGTLSGTITLTSGDVIAPYLATKSAGHETTSTYGKIATIATNGYIRYRTPTEIRSDIGAGTSNFSGAYADLSGTPTIPTVNNGTLTIQKNGTSVGTFTANQSGNTTANITVPTSPSDIGALSLDGGTIKKSKTVKMDASANADGANLKWGTVNSKNPYIGYASDQSDGTFVIGSLLGTNYASGLAIGGGSGNLLWKGTKVATTSDIPSVPTVNNGTLTITENGTSKGTFTANQSGNTTIAFSNATTSAAGLMSAADKTKLDNTNGANTITSFYVVEGDTNATAINDTGITCEVREIEIEMDDGDNYNYFSGQFEVPIVAGDGISITKNSSDKAEIGWSLSDRIKAGTGTLAVCCVNSTATGNYSMAVNSNNTAAGLYSFAAGLNNTANAFQAVFGRNATNTSGPGMATTAGDIFKIGNGATALALTNAMRVTTAGKVYGQSSFGSSGADYAEMWEWADGNPDNEDRRGKFVTVDENNKIRIATTEDEYILGIISATPCVVGDTQSENWREMYLKDVFGQPIVKKVDVQEHVDEETGELVKAHTEEQWVLNPEYDPTRPYVSRDERKEWAAVGLMGKLVVIDDGTCVAGRYCKLAGNGTATTSTDKNDWRVLKRMDSTHVQILYR